MASTNFKIFNESGSAMSDADYGINTQRQNGVVPGIAEPALHNKLYKQATMMGAAIALVMVEDGKNARDDNFQELKNSVKDTFVSKPIPVATVSNILEE